MLNVFLGFLGRKAAVWSLFLGQRGCKVGGGGGGGGVRVQVQVQGNNLAVQDQHYEP